ncbi:sarcosine dehydrogenase, mitochondrial-like [Centruroides sculpturatus]|uniref:sarcosine dehydrogenase, mitochondrial-like n=1 Tax=Centruroides sculpturatus TaxID=218467 RepID=UPI000C6D06A4|nr:sarcosine dehydrogenase, mitochondrial-like [Centruroides sculpturatus]
MISAYSLRLSRFYKIQKFISWYSSASAAPSGVPHTRIKKEDVKVPKSLPSSADVVIIGRNLYEIRLIWRLRPSDTDIEILNHTRHLLHNVLEGESGVHPGWINNGGLFIANSKERLQEYKRLMTVGKAFGIDSFILSPQETKELYPLMNVSDLYGTLYSPGDGTVDPAGFCTSLTRIATKAGAKVIEKCPVIDISVEEDDFNVKRIKSVVTEFGKINTNCVVNCTGVWAPYIGNMAGVKVPLIAMKHAYVVTDHIEGIQNMPNARDHDLSVYLRLQGDALSIGGYEPNPIFIDQIEKDFAFGLYELDWDVFGTHIESAIHRIPALENVGIKSTVCGPESFTPDHKPLLGEDTEIRGFFHGCGFNSLGMNAGGGCGRELARWIFYGRPELDMYSYDIRRFSSKLTNNKQWIKERSHESYAKNYSIVYPHDEPLASRNMRKDPFHEELLNNGCIFQERLGWERPGWFTRESVAPIGNECLGCRENVAVFNMSYFGKFYLMGPDAQKAADWIFTNDVNKPIGSTTYTCMLNARGGVEADLTVSSIKSGDNSSCDPKFDDDGFYIAAAGAASQQNFSHIQSTIQDKKFQVSLIDASEEMGMLSIQGPKSRELLQLLTDEDLSNEAFPFSSNKVINFAGHKVRALRLTFVGEMGWELHIPKESCLPIYKALMNEGKKFNLINAGYRAIDSLSIEKGYRHWHADIRMDDTPLEGSLGFTCKLKTSVPFLGRDMLEKQKKEGLKKRLVCFTLDEPIPLWGLEAIWRNNRIVGFLRRGDYAFALGKSIGYGYVKAPGGDNISIDYIKSGDYKLECMGVTYPANVHLKTPFDPANKRIKGIYDEPLPIYADKYV